MPLNSREIRLKINPILTSIVQGYKDPALVGEALFPRVPVTTTGGQVLEFGKESFKEYNTRRAPGSSVKRMTFGFLGKPYALENHALESPVPRESQRDAETTPHIDLGKKASEMVMQIHLRELEIAQAAIACNSDNYDADHKLALTGSAQWTNPDSNPKKDIEDAKEAIRATVGIRPNVLLLSAKACIALKDHPKLIERFKYTTHETITTGMLASLFEIPKIVVGESVFANEKEEFVDIWGNNAILAYVPTSPSSNGEPSYGYTYTMEGHPLVEEPYYENNTRSWVYGVTFERVPVLSGMLSGFLIQNPRGPVQEQEPGQGGE